MRILPVQMPLVLMLSFLPIACKKPQVTAAASPMPTVKRRAAIAPEPFKSDTIHISGEVKRGERFRQPLGSNLFFALEPYAGNDSGWTIHIMPGTDAKSISMDCIGAVSEPLHADKNREIEPPEDLSKEPVTWKPREFEFVPDSANCKAAWELMNLVYYPSKLTDEQRAEAGEKLGKIPTAHGTFTVQASLLRPAGTPNDTGSIEWLQFELELNLAAPLAAATQQSLPGAAPAVPASSANSIRSEDLKPFIASHLGELNPDLADLEAGCGDGQKPLQSLAPPLYADLDGDGQEEAAVQGWSCLSGNGGADFRGVLKLLPDGKLVVLPFEPVPKKFKGRDPYSGLRGHMVIEIKEGRFNEVYGVYSGSEPNCCAEGGERRFLYRWDGHKFVLDDIIDVPPQPEGKQGGS